MLNIKLHGAQNVIVSTCLHKNLRPLANDESFANVSEETRKKFIDSVVSLIDNPGPHLTHFRATGVETYITDTLTYKTAKRGVIQAPPGYICHGKLNTLTREGLDVFFNYFHQERLFSRERDSQHILALFAEDSPFASVTKEVTFVVNADCSTLYGVVFRNVANLDIHVFTNLLIFTRTLTEFHKGDMLTNLQEFLGLTPREAFAMSVILSNSCEFKPKASRVFFTGSCGDTPVYHRVFGISYVQANRYILDYRLCYWPSTFALESAQGKGQLVSNTQASWNPCNYVLSKKPLKDYWMDRPVRQLEKPKETDHPDLKIREFFQKENPTKTIADIFKTHLTKGEQIIVS